MLDIVYYNSSDLKITAVSGDMHSVNRVNFALMHLFGYDFMPRFTKINEKAEKNLVSFNDPRDYQDHFVQPSTKINKDLIISEWDNILRILASLAMKETTQSIIIKKLSSYSKMNPTLKALVEFDKIIMSIYMLNYIDDIDLRRRVHRTLNRGESFHQLRSALLQVSGKKYLGTSDIDFEICNQCNKLLACCIIYYNTSILSALLQKAEALKNYTLLTEIKQFSPVAWQHINLLGNFTFSTGKNILNIQSIIKFLLKNNETTSAL